MHSVIGIGWDVGGWLGKNHGLAAVIFNNDKIEWLSSPMSTSLPASGCFTPSDISNLLNCLQLKNEDKNTTIVLGIDAPLGYPAMFQELVGGGCPAFDKPHTEISNPLAYRETERHIFSVFGKKPLSGTFDKLGNNSSVAITTMRQWVNSYGYAAHPFSQVKPHRKIIIEVYPALLKVAHSANIYKQIKALVPHSAEVNKDAYDASLCAIMALAYGLGGRTPLLPKPVAPKHSNRGKSEGWIYYFAPNSNDNQL